MSLLNPVIPEKYRKKVINDEYYCLLTIIDCYKKDLKKLIKINIFNSIVFIIILIDFTIYRVENSGIKLIVHIVYLCSFYSILIFNYRNYKLIK